MTFSDRFVPLVSTTETLLACKFGIEDETIFTIALTVSLLISAPFLGVTVTEAVVATGFFGSAKTDFSGMASATEARSMSDIVVMVFSSSPSMARFFAICCWKSEAATPKLSNTAYPVVGSAGRSFAARSMRAVWTSSAGTFTTPLLSTV